MNAVTTLPPLNGFYVLLALLALGAIILWILDRKDKR